MTMNDHRSCMPENIVAYIYSEMEPVEVPAFERHLVECAACAEEFAAVSDARLSVFEWKRDAFDLLAVPHFDVPRDKAAVAGVGWFEAIFANIRVLSGAAAFAVLAIVAGLGFYFLKPADSNVNVAAVAPVAVTEKKTDVAQENAPSAVESRPEPTAPEKKESAIVRRQFAPVPVVARTRKPRINNSLVARATPTPQQRQPKLANSGHLPTLNNFEETEDDSLRLADLLADVDVRNDK